MSFEKNPLSRTAALLSAAALVEMFPEFVFLGIEETPLGFLSHFRASDRLPPASLRLLEERVRSIIQQNRPLEPIEMVAGSAREMLKHRGRLEEASTLDGLLPKELVSLVRLGEWSALAEGPFAPLSAIRALQIIRCRDLGEGIYALEGFAASSKEELKKLIRQEADYREKNHWVLGQQMGLWKEMEGELLWLEKGLAVKRALLHFLQTEFCQKQPLPEVSSSLETIEEYAATQSSSFWAYFPASHFEVKNLFDEEAQGRLSQFFSVDSSDLLLQTIRQTFIILGFPDSEPSETSPQGATWSLEDGLGRSHPVVSLVWEKSGRVRIETTIEKILALLLERSLGLLPKWLGAVVDLERKS